MDKKMYPKGYVSESYVQSRVSIPDYFDEIIFQQMPDYYEDSNTDFYQKPVVKCPFHSEDTGSFRYYSDTNTFHCFGCGIGGPSTGVAYLHMKFVEKTTGSKITKQEALNFLNNHFIKKIGVNNAFIAPKKQKEPASTNVELIMYNKYRNELEGGLACDKEISIEKKEELWKYIDMIDILVGTEKINAVDAVQSLRENVRRQLANG